MKPFLIFGLALALVACGLREQGLPDPSGSPSPTGKAPDVCDESAGGTEGLFAPLHDITLASAGSFDRVVFEFVPGRQLLIPSYVVSEISPPLTRDPSDQPLEIEGSFFIRVVFHGSSMQDSSNPPHMTYEGPTEIDSGGFPLLAQVKLQSDTEATLSWVIGLRAKSCWSVQEIPDPPSLIINLPR